MREDGHRGVEAAVLERQRLGAPLHDRRRVRRALGDHHRGRLDRRHLAVGRLVVAGAGADVDDRAGVAERLPDRRRDPRVGRASARVGAPDVVVLHASSRPQRGHPQDDLGRVVARVAVVAARARQRLLHVLDGQDAERARHAGAQLDVLDPARRLVADVVVVVGLAADDRAEAGDAGDAAGLGEVERGERQLVGAGDVVDLERHAGLVERPLGAGDEARGEVLVEAPDGDREVAGGLSHAAPAALPRARRGRARARRAASPRRARGPGGGACGRAASASRSGSARCAGWARAGSGPAR